MEHEKQTAAQPSLYPSAPTGDPYPPPYAACQNPPPGGVAYSQSHPQQPAYPQPYPPVISQQPYHQGVYLSAQSGPPAYAYLAQGSANYSPPQQVVVMTGQPQHVVMDQRIYVSMVGAIVLSCFVFWCCGMLCGLIAFILAMVGQSSASSGNHQGAIQLRNASYGMSVVGVIVGVVLVTLVFVLNR